MFLDQICDISGPTFYCEIYVFFQVSKQLIIWVFSLKHKRVCRPIDIVWRVYCLSRAMEGTWSDFIRLSPPMLLLATIHDGHKTSTCFPLSVSVYLSCARSTNFPSLFQLPSHWVGLWCNWLKSSSKIARLDGVGWTGWGQSIWQRVRWLPPSSRPVSVAVAIKLPGRNQPAT